MRFDLRTHETLALVAGLVGLVEQELARLLFDLSPSTELSRIFGAMVLGSIGLAGWRAGRRNGTE